MKIPTNGINLIVFDRNEHMTIHDELTKGESYSPYIKEVSERLLLGKKEVDKFSFNHAYLVEVSNQIVGYVFISEMRKNQLYLEYSVLKPYRKKGFGKYILENISNYIFENFDNIKQIKLDIKPSNIGSMRTALSAGYDIEDAYDKNTSDNSKNFIRDNPYYVNKNNKDMSR